MLVTVECPYCGEEFLKMIELYIDDGEPVCSDVVNCTRCNRQINFAVEFSVTPLKFEEG